MNDFELNENNCICHFDISVETSITSSISYEFYKIV